MSVMSKLWVPFFSPPSVNTILTLREYGKPSIQHEKTVTLIFTFIYSKQMCFIQISLFLLTHLPRDFDVPPQVKVYGIE